MNTIKEKLASINKHTTTEKRKKEGKRNDYAWIQDPRWILKTSKLENIPMGTRKWILRGEEEEEPLKIQLENDTKIRKIYQGPAERYKKEPKQLTHDSIVKIPHQWQYRHPYIKKRMNAIYEKDTRNDEQEPSKMTTTLKLIEQVTDIAYDQHVYPIPYQMQNMGNQYKKLYETIKQLLKTTQQTKQPINTTPLNSTKKKPNQNNIKKQIMAHQIHLRVKQEDTTYDKHINNLRRLIEEERHIRCRQTTKTIPFKKLKQKRLDKNLDQFRMEQLQTLLQLKKQYRTLEEAIEALAKYTFEEEMMNEKEIALFHQRIYEKHSTIFMTILYRVSQRNEDIQERLLQLILAFSIPQERIHQWITQHYITIDDTSKPQRILKYRYLAYPKRIHQRLQLTKRAKSIYTIYAKKYKLETCMETMLGFLVVYDPIRFQHTYPELWTFPLSKAIDTIINIPLDAYYKRDIQDDLFSTEKLFKKMIDYIRLEHPKAFLMLGIYLQQLLHMTTASLSLKQAINVHVQSLQYNIWKHHIQSIYDIQPTRYPKKANMMKLNENQFINMMF